MNSALAKTYPVQNISKVYVILPIMTTGHIDISAELMKNP